MTDPIAALRARLLTEAGIYTNCRGPLNANGCVEVMPVILDWTVSLLNEAAAALAAQAEREQVNTPQEEQHGHDMRDRILDRGRTLESLKGSIGGEPRAVHGDCRSNDSSRRGEAPSWSADRSSKSFDISDRLHDILTRHGLASRSWRDGRERLLTELITWAADSCRQTMSRQASREQALTAIVALNSRREDADIQQATREAAVAFVQAVKIAKAALTPATREAETAAKDTP